MSTDDPESERNVPVRVRAARAGDYPALCALYEELDAYHREARPDIFVRPDGPPRRRERVEGLIAGPASTILIAERGREGLGFVTLLRREVTAHPVRPAHTFVEADELVVAASWRQCGVGHALMRAAEGWARGQGGRVLLVSVWAFNQAARAFYAAEGFETQTLRLMKRLM